MAEVIFVRGNIRSDTNPLTYEWSKEGSRSFPKALVSNAENILRFLELGFTPNITSAENILHRFNNIEIQQKNYLIQAVIDPFQHHFLHSVISSIQTDEGRLRELLRIHDMWVLYFGAILYKDNPIAKLATRGVLGYRKWAISSELQDHQYIDKPSDNLNNNNNFLSTVSENVNTQSSNDESIRQKVNNRSIPASATTSTDMSNDTTPGKTNKDTVKKPKNTSSDSLLDGIIKQ